MDNEKTYEQWSIENAEKLIKIGHKDVAILRELLICTTNKISDSIVAPYFNHFLDDEELLMNLFEIALEGDDSGDAPWAAANVISNFPATLLSNYRPQLLEIAAYDWDYLRLPAEKSLAKIT